MGRPRVHLQGGAGFYLLVQTLSTCALSAEPAEPLLSLTSSEVGSASNNQQNVFTRMLALHCLQAIKDLPMRGPFLNREDHGFAKSTLRAVLPETHLRSAPD